MFYTPRSHFSRKVRLVLDGLGVDCDLLDVGNVAESEIFGSNPLMKVPALVDGELTIFDSDHIAQYVVGKFDPEDRFDVMTPDVHFLNARAVLNGAMSAEVEWIMAERTGIATAGLPRFQKIRTSIEQALAWLEERAELFPAEPSYLGFHLVSLIDHLVLYDMLPVNHPRLQAVAARLSEVDWIAASAPK